METRNDLTEQDEKYFHQFLDYMATYPNAVVIFQASDIILDADTNVSYLSEPEARSHTAGYFFLESIPSKCAQERLNVPIHLNGNIFFCRFFCRSRNGRMFCDRKIFHNPMEHIRRNGPSTAHYKSMHGQYNSLWNWEWYNQETAVTCNKYTLFWDLWPTNLEKKLIAWKPGQ